MRTAAALVVAGAAWSCHAQQQQIAVPIKHNGESLASKLLVPRPMSLDVSDLDLSNLRGGAERSKAQYINGTFAQGVMNFQGTVVVRNFANLQYFGEITVGNDGQKFTVIFDTGSSDTWLPSSRCTRSCMNKPRYHMSNSYVPDGAVFHEAYGSGAVSGYWSQDDMTIAGMTVKKQAFAEITDASGLAAIYESGGFDGLVGMAFDSISVRNIPTPVQNLKAQGAIEWSVFAFYLGSNGQDGELLIGNVNDKKFTGGMTWIPLAEPSFWVVNLDEISVGGSRKFYQSKHAIIDSGTSLIVGPERDLDAIARSMGARWSWAYGVYLVDNCELARMPPLVFKLGGTEFQLEKEDVILKDASTGICMLAMTPQAANLWILGDVFMRRWYTAFDYTNKRIGIARAV